VRYVAGLFIISVISAILPCDFVFGEPSLRITDCIQSKHQLRYNVYADGFIPNTRLVLSYIMPDAERPNSASSYTDSSGSWKFEGAGYTSSVGVSNGTTTFEAFNVDEKRNMIPDGPYATAELITPCPFVSDPPNTEVYASVNDRQIFDDDEVSLNSIHFTYYIRDNFAPYAQFDCKLDEEQYEHCTIERCEIPGTCIPNTLWYGEKDYDNLLPGQHTFMVRATDDADNTDPTPAEFTWIILKPVADAGNDLTVSSNDIVTLDGGNSSDPTGSSLNYFWNQTAGPEVTLRDSTSSNPTFTAPEVNEQTDLRFELTVVNEEGIVSEPDEVVITVNPIVIPPPTEEPPKTVGDLIKGIIQNPLDVTNSIKSADKIYDILTDNDRDNDQLVCDLINSEDEHTTFNIRNILDC